MIVLNLECKNFRNLSNVHIFPCEKMNVICGENAQGKTNLIEAIWLFTGAKSFRGAKDSEFLKFYQQKAVCNLEFKSKGINIKASLNFENKKTAFLNDKKLKSTSALAGNFNAIVFSPVDLNIVSEGPKLRRKFIDAAICQIYPSYISVLKQYIRAVTQRNQIIKDFKYDSTVSVMLDAFENEIATIGTKIIDMRKRYLELLQEFLPSLYDGISNGKEKLEISYISSCDEELEKSLKNTRKEDMFSGVTSIGPHRDDIDFKINGISARSFGSQGQKRSVALAVKLAEAEVINKKTGEYPVILLDDVMSELDKSRQNFVLNHTKEMQTFLSCCDYSNIENLKDGKIFNVKGGEVF
ncbi:MAG: DNA replication/repair protein RecF [Clostridia bacterium]|nr:DNA replication/repair protein RecF [Clostridia bacterium]